jgi:ribonuclease BN (tRNA processing enzyme)
MKIRFLGAHNTETRDTRLAGLLVDDVLALDAGSLTSSLTLSEQLGLKSVMITHHHYDHVKDLPLLAMNRSLNGTTIDVYCLEITAAALTGPLLAGSLYPDFLKVNGNGKITIKLNLVKPYQKMQIEGYSVIPVPVPHSVPAIGYRITSSEGKSFFYTGDTGAGLSDCWERVSSKLLITEVTASNDYLKFCQDKGHLCPSLLKEELVSHLNVKGYMPDVVAVHMNHMLEEDIGAELKALASELGISITMAFEGKQLII